MPDSQPSAWRRKVPNCYHYSLRATKGIGALSHCDCESGSMPTGGSLNLVREILAISATAKMQITTRYISGSHMSHLHNETSLI